MLPLLWYMLKYWMVETRKTKLIFAMKLFLLEAPFKGEGKSLLKTRDRFSGIIWGDNNTAIANGLLVEHQEYA
jgi:hypothetical protein